MNKSRIKRIATALLALALIVGATGWVTGASSASASQKPSTLPVKAAPVTGVKVYANAKASVDASNLSEGYVMVKYTGGKHVKIKVQITQEGGTP